MPFVSFHIHWSLQVKMASESWEDQAVVVEPPEIKLFGQWSAQDVQVGDISLTVSSSKSFISRW